MKKPEPAPYTDRQIQTLTSALEEGVLYVETGPYHPYPVLRVNLGELLAFEDMTQPDELEEE